MNGWRPITCERFDGENPRAYEARSAEIVEIVSNFRIGRYDRALAERMERRLLELQNPLLARSREDA